jgi:hypothetical protein
MFLGVKSPNPLFPILEPQYVVDQIMKAVLTNEIELFLPSTVTITYLARFLFPVGVRDWVQDRLAISKSMDEFKGLRKI